MPNRDEFRTITSLTMRLGQVLAPRIATVRGDSESAFPITFIAADLDTGKLHVVQMSAIDAVRLGQRLTDAGCQVHAERKAAQA